VISWCNHQQSVFRLTQTYMLPAHHVFKLMWWLHLQRQVVQKECRQVTNIHARFSSWCSHIRNNSITCSSKHTHTHTYNNIHPTSSSWWCHIHKIHSPHSPNELWSDALFKSPRPLIQALVDLCLQYWQQYNKPIFLAHTYIPYYLLSTAPQIFSAQARHNFAFPLPSPIQPAACRPVP